ncbi:zinc finger protein 652 isoform X2 [Nasonia vitripennis]|nr:zinc finger protein 652 isoform X2 [Nasonia vitripennis]
MMAVQQRASVPVIEEVLISDSEEDDVIIVDDEDETSKFEETKEFIHTIDYGCSSKNGLYNNGDFEHLPQLRQTEEIYLDEDYEFSDASNHSSNEAISTININSSDKENVPVQDPVRVESNDRSADSDDERFYIAEDCSNMKDVLDHLENNEKMEVEADVANLSNHKAMQVRTDASIFKGGQKIIVSKDLKHDHIDADADKLVIDESMTIGNRAVTDKSKDVKLGPKELMIETSSDDDSEEAQDDQVITISVPQTGSKTRTKRFLRMHCDNCGVTKSVPKLSKPEACICKFCESTLNFQCKTCLRCFETYGAALCHLKRKCASKYFWQCPDCDYAVRDQSKFDMHIQKAHANKTIRCPHCRKIMYDQKLLDEHVKESCAMKAPRYSCNSCDFKERLLTQIKRHLMRSHCVLEGGYRTIGRHRTKSLDNTIQPISESEITNPASATAEPKATEEKPNTERLIKLHCIKCKITFKKTPDIGMKCKHCNGSLVYQCKMCKERSKSLCGIYDHIDNNCEFIICKQCNNRFKTKADAIKHKEACGRVTFKCKMCNYKTRQKTYLQIHIDSKHNNENIITQK